MESNRRANAAARLVQWPQAMGGNGFTRDWAGAAFGGVGGALQELP